MATSVTYLLDLTQLDSRNIAGLLQAATRYFIQHTKRLCLLKEDTYFDSDIHFYFIISKECLHLYCKLSDADFKRQQWNSNRLCVFSFHPKAGRSRLLSGTCRCAKVVGWIHYLKTSLQYSNTNWKESTQ